VLKHLSQFLRIRQVRQSACRELESTVVSFIQIDRSTLGMNKSANMSLSF